MAVRFRNQTNRDIYVVFAHSAQCENSNWVKRGWWRVSPGETVTVRGGASNGATYLWHASSGSARWEGPYQTQVPPRQFDWCWNTGSTDSDTVGMRRLSVPVTSINHSIVLR